MIGKIPHQMYYVIELFVLLAGFFALFAYSFDKNLQLLVLGVVLMFYIILGIIHHKVHHTLKSKIVIEYILISAIVFFAFIFLNTGNL